MDGEPHPVSPPELHQGSARGGGAAVCGLLADVGEYHPLVVAFQFHVAQAIGERAVELKFVDAGLHAGEHPCARFVVVLSVVDYLTEGDGLVRFGVVETKAHSKGGFDQDARRPGRSSSAPETTWSLASWNRRDSKKQSRSGKKKTLTHLIKEEEEEGEKEEEEEKEEG